MVTWEAKQIKQCIGAFLLTALITLLVIRPKPRAQIHLSWTALAGLLSGTFVGLVGMGGPPISLWVIAHDWPPLKKRCFLWLSFLLLLPIHAGLLVWQFGQPLFAAIVTATVLAPATIVGAWSGAWLGGKLNAKGLRIAMMSLLFFIAVRSIAAPWFG